MASTYSTSLRLEMMATGDFSGTWGTKNNTNIGTLLEQAVAGYAAVAMTDADYTLVAANGASDEARNAVVKMTGALTATRAVIVPTAVKLYLIWNGTTGSQSITVKTAAGTGVTIPNTYTAWAYCDGTNVVAGGVPYSTVGGGIVGNLIGSVTGNVTGSASLNMLKAGDTMTGDLLLSKASPAIFLQKAASGQASTVWGTKAGLARWTMSLGTGDAESGGNAGSFFALTYWDDAGAVAVNSIAIYRTTGQIFIEGPVVFNNTQAASADFRVAGDTDASLLVTDPTNDRVGVGTSSPLTKLHVNGTITDDVGAVRNVAISNKTGAYVLASTDAGKCISITTGGVTLNSLVFVPGDRVRIYNNSASSQTITTASVLMYLAGTGSFGARTLAQRGLCEIYCFALDSYVISGTGVT